MGKTVYRRENGRLSGLGPKLLGRANLLTLTARMFHSRRATAKVQFYKQRAGSLPTNGEINSVNKCGKFDWAIANGAKISAERAMKVVLNRAVGSCFSLSSAALAKLAELKGWDRRQSDPHGPILDRQFVSSAESGRPDWLLSLERNDGDLVRLVEEFGPAAAGPNAELMIVEIPDGGPWKISEVVGYEYVVVNGNIS
jgi:hypothetical protein